MEVRKISVFKKRTSGVLMPIFSLPSDTGIGTLGFQAYEFIRFLKETGQKYWQILPICPPAKEDSPYLSYSARAGNPYLIDIDWLVGEGWLSEQDLKLANIKSANLDFEGAEKHNSPYPSKKINYTEIKLSRGIIFAILYKNFFNNTPPEYNKFCKENKDWLEDYALFMSILEYHNFKDLENWEDKYKYRDIKALQDFSKEHIERIKYHKMLQYFFFDQWNCLLEFAHKNDIKIIGDIPIYVALTSADAWVEPHIFDICEDYSVSTYSGCPANKANKKESIGQIWDSPVYNWEYLKKTNYSWWIKRLKSAFTLYDIIRIDHFKGFESYYNIDAITRDPRTGTWKKGPGLDFWKYVSKQLGYNSVGDMPIFAEDLGIITPELRKLLDDCDFEGIKVVQYGFANTKKPELYIDENRPNNDNKYLPQNYTEKYVSYLSTHDTPPILGFIDTVKEGTKINLENFYQTKNRDELYEFIFKDVYNSDANIAILTIQDILKLGYDARINTPGTTKINWMWQMTKDQFSSIDREKLLKITRESGRL